MSSALCVSRLQSFLRFFDLETAAVVSILLGVIQILLSAPLYYTDISHPKSLFVLPLLIGTLVVVGGSLTLASSRSTSRHLRHGWAYSNVAGLLGSALALGLYCFSLSSLEEVDCEGERRVSDYYYTLRDCLERSLENLFWCVTVLLLCYDAITLLLLGALTVTSIRALRGR